MATERAIQKKNLKNQQDIIVKLDQVLELESIKKERLSVKKERAALKKEVALLASEVEALDKLKAQKLELSAEG